MTLETRLAEIKKRCEDATEGPWVWGDWDILDEDREAQRKGEPYWTLVANGYHHMFLCKGPIGRKTLDIEIVARSSGYDEDDIEISEVDAHFIANARTDIPMLLEMVEMYREAFGHFKDDKNKRVIEERLKQIAEKYKYD